MGQVQQGLLQRKLVIALAIIIAGLSIYSARLKQHILNSYDQVLYLHTAGQIAYVRTDGHAQPLGIAIAPVYPVFIAALTYFDSNLAATVECTITPPQGDINACPNRLGILIWAQLLIAVGTSLVLWRTAYFVTRSEPIALIALAAASFGSAEYAEYAHAAMTETPTFFFFAGFDLAFLFAVERRSPRTAALAGLLLGVATLTRPAFLYLGLVIIVAVIALAIIRTIFRHQTPWPAFRLGTSFALAFAAIVTPWIVRNYLQFGVADITEGYGANTLIQRLAYDEMQPREWAAGWIYFLPDFGHSWAKALLPTENYQRLGYEATDAFYVAGSREAAAAPIGQTGPSILALVRSRVLPHLDSYLAVTVLLAWRGLWIGRYFSVATVPMLFWKLARVRDPRWPALTTVALPPLFMLFFQAAISVNASRYNILLEPVMAIAAGEVLYAWAMALLHRFGARGLTAP